MADPLGAALHALGQGRSLTHDEARDAFGVIVAGGAGDVPIAALLTALRLKGETADELLGALEAVRGAMVPFEATAPALDTCGTGGDGARTLNVSTAAALVVAACGVPVAKHGNRSASGNSGSSEVLAELGIAIDAPPSAAARSFHELGITFLYAPLYHPALRHAAGVRRQLPFRTLFNLLGPLANPARPAFQLVGVPDTRLAALVASALARSGVRRAAVVTGSDGLDEVTLDGPTTVELIEDGESTCTEWTPGHFGLPHVDASALVVSGPAESAGRLRSIFAGVPGPGRDVVLANAAAALFVAGRVPSLKMGVELAAGALDRGDVAALLARWADVQGVGANRSAQSSS